MKNASLLLSFGASLGLSVVSASGQVLFQENFDTDVSANWTVNASHANTSADFAFDYSTVGIPSAPNSVGGTTLGVRMAANWSAGAMSGISISPTGQSFTGDFVLQFDYWANFNGPMDIGGSGSTQVTGFGIGTAGTTPQWAGGSHDSLHFGATGDGQSSFDYRVYPNGALADDASGIYAAGSRRATNAYYAGIGGKAAPESQVTLYPGQSGVTPAGAAGMAWREMTVTKSGDTVTWHMDGLLIATVENYSSLGVGGSNILFSHYDINSSSSADPNDFLLFGLIDNVTVTAIPEPSTYAAIFGGLALMGAFVYRRRRGRM